MTLPDFVVPLIAPLLAGALGACLSVILGDRYNRRLQSAALATARDLDHVRRQLDELYGPLQGYLTELETVDRIRKERLTKLNSKQSTHDVASEEKRQFEEIWRYFIERELIPLKRRMADIICTKRSLLLRDTLPSTFKAFISHQASEWSLFYLWKTTNIQSDHISLIQFPSEMKKDVDEAIKELTDKDKVLTGQYRLVTGQVNHLGTTVPASSGGQLSSDSEGQSSADLAPSDGN